MSHSRSPQTRRSTAGDRLSRRRLPLLGLAAAVLGVATFVHATQDLPADDPQTLILRLGSEATDAETRLQAARTLLSLAADPSVLAMLEAAIVPPEGSEASRGRRALLVAIATTDDPPALLFKSISAVAQTAGHPDRVESIAALASYRTRESAGVLLQIASGDAELAGESLRALAKLTGKTGLGTDLDRWRAWQAETLGLSDRQWLQRLADAHARRADDAERRATAADQRLIDAYRQIHLLTPAAERSRLLASMLQSDVRVLQLLGFDLANREISESQVLRPVVAQATIALLASPSAEVRSQAAILLDRLAPMEAPEQLFAALSRETDPRAADAMLRAVSRWPSPLARGPVLQWLRGPLSIRSRAAGTAWTLLREGLFSEEAERVAVLEAVRTIPDDSLNGAGTRILVTLGEEADLARVRALLLAEEPVQRTLAADALALRADQVEHLLRHATDDPVLFEPTAKAVRAHMRDARGYDALARLGAPSPRVRADALAAQASVLPTSELVRLAQLQEPAEAIFLLTPLTSPHRLEDDAAAEELANGLVLLARTHAALGNPSEGLNALTLVPASADETRTAELTDLRAVFLLWLNRIDQAEAAGASADAWLEGLERSAGEAHAAAIIERLETTFGSTLSEAQTSRLDAVRRQLASAETGGDDGG